MGTEFFLGKAGVQVVTLVMSVEMWLVVLMVPVSISEVDLPDTSFYLITGARSGWQILGGMKPGSGAGVGISVSVRGEGSAHQTRTQPDTWA